MRSGLTWKPQEVISHNDTKTIIHEIKHERHKTERKAKFRIFSKVIGLLSLIRYTFASPKFRKTEAIAYYSECDKICGKKQVDVIIAMSFPLETALAVKHLKKKYPTVKTIIYELDKACAQDNRKLSGRIMRRSYQRTMKKLYLSFDKIIIMRSHENYWCNTFYQFASKLQVADLPMLYQHEASNGVTKDKGAGIFLIYSGLLDRHYRNPQVALNVFDSELLDEYKPTLLFFSKGDCDDILKRSKRACCCGYVSKAELDVAIEKADFLLNIGNQDSDSVPSKLIAYLSTGKPIIHFAHNKNDSCLNYLEKYPLSLILYETDSLAINSEKVFNFIREKLGMHYDFETIAETFVMNTPKYSCDLILKE